MENSNETLGRKLKVFLPVCFECPRHDIYENIAWCFYNRAYRNHAFMKICPGKQE